MIMPPEMFGVKVVSIGLFTVEDNPVVWRGPMLHKALQQFLTDVHWNEPDYLLIDLPPGTGDVSISIAEFLPGASMSHRHYAPGGGRESRGARRLHGGEDRPQPRRCGREHVLLPWYDGTAYPIFGSGGGASLAEKLHVPLLGQIPIDPELRELADAGAPIVLLARIA